MVAAVAAGALSGISGCSTNPHAPDIAAPDAEPVAQTGPHHEATKTHQGVQLPSTLTVTYDRTPVIQDAQHHMILWTATQAVKAQFEASYQKTSAATADLDKYWTGPGYTAAYNWAQTWISAKRQPVGRVVIFNPAVQNSTGTESTVFFCEDMSLVKRGVDKTNQFDKGTVQAPGSNGQRIELTLKQSGPNGAWQVTAMSAVADSPQCPPIAEHHKGKH